MYEREDESPLTFSPPKATALPSLVGASAKTDWTLDVNIFRRLSVRRLVLVCALAVAIGVSATALASAVGSGPTPAEKPLAQAVHDALSAPHVQGVSANIQLTDHLLEGANLASGGGQAGELISSPLVKGGSGRLWIAQDGRVRLELQAEKGDTEIYYDGKTVTVYDAATNTLYRYTVPAGTGGQGDTGAKQPEAPSVAKIEEAIARIKKHANLSGATPADVAGQPAYTVRVSPHEGGSLIGGAELSFDAVHGVPLRAAVYSSSTPSPVIELAATEVSYGPVEDSVFAFTPPPGVKVQEIKPGGSGGTQGSTPSTGAEKPKVTTHGHGITGIAVVEAKAKQGSQSSTSSTTEGLPKVDINGAKASELRTALGTVLSFERSGVRYVVAGAVAPAAVEEVARGL
jgi:outer membrane lipoprotein-sorting protein